MIKYIFWSQKSSSYFTGSTRVPLLQGSTAQTLHMLASVTPMLKAWGVKLAKAIRQTRLERKKLTIFYAQRKGLQNPKRSQCDLGVEFGQNLFGTEWYWVVLQTPCLFCLCLHVKGGKNRSKSSTFLCFQSNKLLVWCQALLN